MSKGSDERQNLTMSFVKNAPFYNTTISHTNDMSSTKSK